MGSAFSSATHYSTTEHHTVHVVGISGLQGSGKSTYADYLVRRHGYVELSFAAVLKSVVAKLFALDLRMFTDPELKNCPIPSLSAAAATTEHEIQTTKKSVTPRLLMQRFGTELLRERLFEAIPELELEIVPGIATRNIFVYHLIQQMKVLLLSKDSPPPRGIVISDIRFEDELNGVRQFIENFNLQNEIRSLIAKDPPRRLLKIEFHHINVIDGPAIAKNLTSQLEDFHASERMAYLYLCTHAIGNEDLDYDDEKESKKATLPRSLVNNKTTKDDFYELIEESFVFK